MPTPLPPKGTVLQTAEFADSLYSPIKWSIVSHIIPYYFNSWGTGSHLYTANANTLRSAHWVKVLLALVGTHISWSPCPPLLCFYYSTLLAICQALFCQVLYFSEKILGENLVAVFPIEWVLDASAYHSCGTGKGFSVGCPSHSRCFRLPAQRMQLLSSLCT